MKNEGKALKVILIVLVVLVLVVFALLLARNVIAERAAKFFLENQTDLTMEVENLNIGFFLSTVDVQGLRVFNPEGFRDRVMIDLPRFSAEYNLFDILAGRMHFSSIVFHLNQFLLVKEKDGVSNIDSLKKFMETSGEERTRESVEAEEDLDLHIERLHLRIGRVTIRDYTKGPRPVADTNVNLDQEFTDVTNIRQFTSALLVAHMNEFVQYAFRMGLGNMAGFFGDSVDAVGRFGTDAIRALTDVGGGTIGEAGRILERGGQQLENIIRMPFGR